MASDRQCTSEQRDFSPFRRILRLIPNSRASALSSKPSIPKICRRDWRLPKKGCQQRAAMADISQKLRQDWVFGSTTPYAEAPWARGGPSPYYNDSHRRLRKAMRDWMEEVSLNVSIEYI